MILYYSARPNVITGALLEYIVGNVMAEKEAEVMLFENGATSQGI